MLEKLVNLKLKTLILSLFDCRESEKYKNQNGNHSHIVF